MILGQDALHLIRSLEYFESDRQDTPVAVRLPLEKVLVGSLPSTSGLVCTCLKALIRSDDYSELADQLRKWYHLEP